MSSIEDLFASLPPQKLPKAAITHTKPIASTAADAQVLNFFLSHLKQEHLASYADLGDGQSAGLTPLPCESIGELLASVKSKLKLTPSAEDTFILMMAVAISLEMDGPFIWAHIAGASSSLKTTFLDMLATANDKVYATTEFTSFFSGSTVGNKNNSLFARIQGRVFVIKDLTPLLQNNKDTQNTVFSQFRAIYDGTAEKFFNNGVEYNTSGVRFVCLTGVTNIIYKYMRTDMGERFLIIDMNHQWNEDGCRERGETDLSSDGNAYDSLFDTLAGGFAEDGPRIDQLDTERRMCWGLLHHLIEYMQDESHGLRSLAAAFKSDRTIKAEIDALAVWMEHARCPMPGKGDDQIRAVPAEPHRSIKQLSKMLMALAVVTKASAPTDEIRRLVKKVAFDSACGFNLEIMNYLARHPLRSRGILASKMKLSAPKVAQHCEHLISIGVLEVVISPPVGGGEGQPSHNYRLTMKFRIIADMIGLTEVSDFIRKPTSPAPGGLEDLFTSLAAGGSGGASSKQKYGGF